MQKLQMLRTPNLTHYVYIAQELWYRTAFQMQFLNKERSEAQDVHCGSAALLLEMNIYGFMRFYVYSCKRPSSRNQIKTGQRDSTQLQQVKAISGYFWIHINMWWLIKAEFCSERSLRVFLVLPEVRNLTWTAGHSSKRGTVNTLQKTGALACLCVSV